MQAADSRPVCRTHFNLIHIFSTLKSAGLKLRNIHIYACGIFVLIFTHTQTQTHTYELMMPSHSNILLSLFAACHFAFVWRCVYLIFLFSCITISQLFFFLTWPPSPHHHTISFGMSTLFASFMTKAFHVFVTRPCFFGEETQNFAYFWHWKRSKNYKLQARWNRCAAEEMGFLKCSTDIPFYKCDQLLI